MTTDQLTALARVYAEEENPINSYCNHSERDWDIQIDADSAERVIRFLLRRYCLVEKKDVEAKYKEAKERYFDPDDEIEKTMYGCRMSLLEYLFPEIAKEVKP